MIKKYIRIKEREDTYLTHVCRHRWSRQITMKGDENGASARTTADESHSAG